MMTKRRAGRPRPEYKAATSTAYRIYPDLVVAGYAKFKCRPHAAEFLRVAGREVTHADALAVVLATKNNFPWVVQRAEVLATVDEAAAALKADTFYVDGFYTAWSGDGMPFVPEGADVIKIVGAGKAATLSSGLLGQYLLGVEDGLATRAAVRAKVGPVEGVIEPEPPPEGAEAVLATGGEDEEFEDEDEPGDDDVDDDDEGAEDAGVLVADTPVVGPSVSVELPVGVRIAYGLNLLIAIGRDDVSVDEWGTLRAAASWPATAVEPEDEAKLRDLGWAPALSGTGWTFPVPLADD